MAQQYRMEELEIAQIVFDDELQVRIETNQEMVQEYYAAMETEEDVKKFPPPTVYFDGCRHWLADGRHRYLAARGRGFEKMLVKVFDGSHDDAILAAVKLNAQHGLRFSDGDWEKIIPLITSKEQWKNWTNRRLAEELGCSEFAIRKYRPDESVAIENATEKRVGKDGKMYKAKKDKKPKADPPKPETLSDTAPQSPPVAKETELSPSTPTTTNDATVAKSEAVTETMQTAHAASLTTEFASMQEDTPAVKTIAEANAAKGLVIETIELLASRINDWFDLAPAELTDEFAKELCQRIGELITNTSQKGAASNKDETSL